MTNVAQGSPSRPDHQPASTELGGLVARTAQGDHDAFAAVYDETVATSFRLTLAVLGDPQTAESVTCAAYAEVWDRAHEFDVERHDARSWVTTIVYESARSARGARAA